MQTTAPAARAATNWHRPWGRALALVAGIEVGLVLLALPWTRLWVSSYTLAQMQSAHPWLWAAASSSYLRGAVSGLGLVNLWIATSEITGFQL